jgi:hypothetical protein
MLDPLPVVTCYLEESLIQEGLQARTPMII